jgi:N-terminal acetyltransferase B complex non-catalytic subunit
MREVAEEGREVGQVSGSAHHAQTTRSVDGFQALKAYVLVNQPDEAQIAKGEAETLQLCARNPAVTDFDTIHILQDALRDLSLEDQEGSKLWERAAAAKPGDKAILMTWLRHGIEDSQWQTAQKV